MAMLAKVRRMFHRERLSAREIARKTGLSRTTVDRWLKLTGVVEPKYAARKVVTKICRVSKSLETRSIHDVTAFLVAHFSLFIS